MIHQTVLPFKLKITRDTITSHAGYMPMVGNLAENGLVVGDEFREGNESPGSRNLEFIKYCMEWMPCGQTVANAVFFRIGAMAYNICRLFVLKTLAVGWHKHQVQTPRWRLFQTAGKVVVHANRVYLKVRRGFYALFDEIRLRIWEFTQV